MNVCHLILQYSARTCDLQVSPSGKGDFLKLQVARHQSVSLTSLALSFQLPFQNRSQEISRLANFPYDFPRFRINRRIGYLKGTIRNWRISGDDGIFVNGEL